MSPAKLEAGIPPPLKKVSLQSHLAEGVLDMQTYTDLKEGHYTHTVIILSLH